MSNKVGVEHQPVILGMGNLPPLMTGILIMGPYKPLRTWVDEFIPYYMEMSWELIDPIAHLVKRLVFPIKTKQIPGIPTTIKTMGGKI